VNARFSLPADPQGVSHARRFTTQTLIRWSLAHISDDAALLVGELATNALLHGGEPAELRLVADDQEVRVEVHDSSGLLPRARHYGPTSTTGRGLRLVNSLSSAWGAERTANGKQVWFTLPLHPDPGVEQAFVFDLSAIEPL
jgi:anti-sigma regulatory factor (Ser/Thr protein kinase)